MKSLLTHAAAAFGGAALAILAVRGATDPPPIAPTQTAPLPSKTVRQAETVRPGIAISGRSDRGHAESRNPDPAAVLSAVGYHGPTRADLMEYIASRGRAAEAVFAAGVLLGDADLLREASEKEPDNSHFAFVLATCTAIPASERKEALARWCRLDPSNALSHALSGASKLESGRHADGIAALRRAQNESLWDDYSRDTSILMEDALLATGSTATGALIYSAYHLQTPHHFEILEIPRALNLDDGVPAQDEERALLADLGVVWADQPFSNSIMSDQVGLALQASSLRGLSPDDASPWPNSTVAEVQAAIQRQRDEIRNTTIDPEMFLTLPEETIDAYARRLRSLGEAKANAWLIQQGQAAEN